MTSTVTVKKTNKGKAELIEVVTPFGTFQRETLRLGGYDFMAVSRHTRHQYIQDDKGYNKLDSKGRVTIDESKPVTFTYYDTFSATAAGAKRNAESYNGVCVYLVNVRTGEVLIDRSQAPVVAQPERTPREARKVASDRREGYFLAEVVVYKSLEDFEADLDALVQDRPIDRPCGRLNCATIHPNGHPFAAWAAKWHAEELARKHEYNTSTWEKIATIRPIKAADYDKADPYLRAGYLVKRLKDKATMVYAVRELKV